MPENKSGKNVQYFYLDDHINISKYDVEACEMALVEEEKDWGSPCVHTQIKKCKRRDKLKAPKLFRPLR